MVNDHSDVYRNKTGIRPTVFMFFLFEVLMLFQTDYLNLGTIVAGASSVLVVITYMLEFQGKISLNAGNILVFCYLVVLGFGTFVTGLSSKLTQFAVYVLIYILLSPLEVNEKEKRLLIDGFVWASVFYAALVIYSRLSDPTQYYHSRITLFGSSIDPNYVGLPLIMSFSIFLFEIFNERKSALKIVALAVLAFAILLTSSRGNFLALALCVIGNVLHLLNNRKLSLFKKGLIIALTIIALIIFYNYASNNYGDFLNRMILFDQDETGNGRRELWKQGIDLWLEKPIFGGGYEALGRQIRKGAHNTYVQLLCDTGIVGFILFVSFLVGIVKKCYRRDKNLFFAMLGLLSHSFFLGAISNRCFWVGLIMVGMAVSKNSQDSDNAKTKSANTVDFRMEGY